MLITDLFSNLEVRGTDASGIWGTESGNNSKIYYHKQAIRSSYYVNCEFWRDLQKVNLDSLIVHSRAASKGPFHALANQNNHPFVADNHQIAIAHNGCLDEAEFLKEKYEIQSDTDSEYLLRIYENSLIADSDLQIEDVPEDVICRLRGIKDIWSVINTGAMAVAVGERIDDYSRSLFLFRNEKRPLWVADMREALGQIFFFSSPDIWYDTICSNSEIKALCGSTQKIIEVPSHQIWYFKIDKDNPVVSDNNKFKFKVNVGDSKKWNKGKYLNIKHSVPTVPIVTKNDVNRHFLGNKNKTTIDNSSVIRKTSHVVLCNKICQLSDNIVALADKKLSKHSINVTDYTNLLFYLDQTKKNLESTLHMLKETHDK